MNIEQKIRINALIDSNKQAIDFKEKARIITYLHTKLSYQEISKLTGIPRTTLQHIEKPQPQYYDKSEYSLMKIYNKLKELQQVEDKELLLKIRTEIERLLK